MTTNKLEIEQFKKLDGVATQAMALYDSAKGGFEVAGATAIAVQMLRDSITENVAKAIHSLQNTPLGFLTDNKAGYPPDVVRDCYLEATLRGVRPAGNEFNIISGRCYITQAGYRGKLDRLEGFTDFDASYSVPMSKDQGAIIKCKATWKMNGKPDSKEAEIAVRLNAGQGVDAALGKAKRKFLKDVFEKATGRKESDEEFDPIDHAKPAKAEVSAPSFAKKEGELV
jgi:hypothetical protein